MYLQIWYEIVSQTVDYVVVNKSPGIAVQGAADSLLYVLKRDLHLDNLFPVHRLDVATSGLVIFAKTIEANQALSGAFRERQVEKFYLAISDKKPSKKQGSIIGDMSKARNGSYKLLRSRENPAKTAFFSYSVCGATRLFVIKLLTGKTHQARVAMKSLGSAIIGDERYGGSLADRLYLHAWKLRINWRGCALEFQCMPKSGEHFFLESVNAALCEIGPPENLSWPR